MIKAILIHGNGNSKPTDNWLPYLKTELQKLGAVGLEPTEPEGEGFTVAL